MSDALLLSLLWCVPLVGSLLILLIPTRAELAVKVTALAITLITFGLTLFAFNAYLTPNASGQAPSAVALADRALQNTLTERGLGESIRLDVPNDLVVRHTWVPYFNIQYYLGLDGISLALTLLTSLVSVLACLASWTIERQVKGYFSLFLVLVASMIGVFLALDMFLFYVFFEVMLLPMYFLIGIWGGAEREYAAIKFLLYTLFGSVFILIAILILYFWSGDTSATEGLGGPLFTAHSFDMLWVARAASETTYYTAWAQRIVFVLFLVGFLVKLPSFPFHTWLPDAHVQAPTPISMILAGVLLKVGGYGLVRLAWPLAPLGAAYWSWYVAALGVFSILYGALAAMAQNDFKKLVAYSSVSHMGYVTLGLAAMSMLPGTSLTTDPRFYAYGVNGAMFMMIAHGITSTGMFFLVGVIYERAHTHDLRKLGGLFNPMPGYGAVSFLIFFGSMGLPGLCGFIAEVFVVLAAFNYNRVLGVLAAAAVVLTAGYILWTFQRVFLGRNEQYRGMPDLTPREWIISIPLVILTIVLGIFPQSILNWMSPSVDAVVRNVARANADAPSPPSVARLTNDPTAR